MSVSGMLLVIWSLIRIYWKCNKYEQTSYPTVCIKLWHESRPAPFEPWPWIKSNSNQVTARWGDDMFQSHRLMIFF